MQINATMRFHYIPIRMPEIKKTIPNADNDMEKLDLSYIAGGKVK